MVSIRHWPGSRSSFRRHFVDYLRIQRDGSQVSPPLERFSTAALRRARYAPVGSIQKVICPHFPPSRRTSPIVPTSLWMSSANAGMGLRRRSSTSPIPIPVMSIHCSSMATPAIRSTWQTARIGLPAPPMRSYRATQPTPTAQMAPSCRPTALVFGVNGGAKLGHRGGAKLGHSAVGCLSK